MFLSDAAWIELFIDDTCFIYLLGVRLINALHRKIIWETERSTICIYIYMMFHKWVGNQLSILSGKDVLAAPCLGRLNDRTTGPSVRIRQCWVTWRVLGSWYLCCIWTPLWCDWKNCWKHQHKHTHACMHAHTDTHTENAWRSPDLWIYPYLMVQFKVHYYNASASNHAKTDKTSFWCLQPKHVENSGAHGLSAKQPRTSDIP